MISRSRIFVIVLAVLLAVIVFVIYPGIQARKPPYQKHVKDHRFSMVRAFETFENLSDADIKHFDEAATVAMIPSYFQCEPSKYSRIGGENDKFGDGGKFVCGEYVTKGGILFSLGSNGDFSFEIAMLKAFPTVTIHTFDCTGDFAHLAPKSGVVFHKWCLGDRDEIGDGGRIFKTWTSILSELSIRKVDYLKMDIEGFEWNTLPYILDAPKELLPIQISFELHLENWMLPKSGVPDYLVKPPGQSWFKPVMRLFKKFVYRGYGIVSNEINLYNSKCSEYVLVLAD